MACEPAPSVYYGGPSGQNVQTGADFMTTGIKLDSSFIAEVDSPAKTRAKDLRAFYKDQDYFTTFFRNGRWSWAGAQSFTAIRNAASEGLRPEDYLPVSMLQSRSLDMIDPRTADVLLTAGLMAYMADLHQGAFNPAKKNIGPGLLREGVERRDYNVFLAGIAPKGRSYGALKSVLNGRKGNLTNTQRRKIAVNMERLRWDHEAAGALRDIRVNIASQSMEVFERGRLVHDMTVVVGRKSRKTPVMQDRIVSLKFSPDWSVPPLIAREDILPILQDDPSLIGLMGIRVLDASGAEIPAASVDWQAVDPYAIPYRFRMEPGIDNLLGGVRFSLTNDQAIFLHDSPERDRYGAGVRTFSSGCVRVGDSAGLASWIMGRQMNWERKDVIAAMVRGKTRIEVLPDPIAVDFVYSTVGMKDDGALFFKPDIYGEDAKLARRIGLSVNDVPPPIPKPRL